MSAEKMYRPLKVHKSKGEFVSQLHGQDIKYAHLLSDELRSGTLLYAIEETDRDSDVTRIVPLDKRVHEINGGLKDTSSPITDEYGNIFSSRVTQKGVDFTNSHLFESNVSRWGYDIFGNQVGGALGRALCTSDLMRKEGVDAELIVGATKLEEFYWKGEIVDRATYNQRLLETVDVDDDEKKRLLTEIEKRELFNTYRLMAVLERFLDLFTPKTNKDVAQLQNNLLDAIYIYEHHKADLDPEYIPQTFDPSSMKDINRYITQYVPQNLGRNLGLMHGIGLYHQYLHLRNVTALGDIVDLDSARGKITGFPNDTPATPSDMNNDIERVLEEFRSEILKEDKGQQIRYKHIDSSSYATFRKELMYSYFKKLHDKNTFSLFILIWYMPCIRI